jgi:hypothetical protein
VRDPAPPYEGEGPHALWHVSEDASIRTFHPHRSATATGDAELVWAVDTRHLPMFWFPRDCPRATFWPSRATSTADLERFFDGEQKRVHATEHAWLGRIRSAAVVAYRLPEETFRPHDEVGGYWVSDDAVDPVELFPLGDLVARHAVAEIELRFVRNLWPLWDRVTSSSVEFSGSRLRNAAPRDQP